MNQRARDHDHTLWAAATRIQTTIEERLHSDDISAIIKAENSGRLEKVFNTNHTPKRAAGRKHKHLSHGRRYKAKG